MKPHKIAALVLLVCSVGSDGVAAEKPNASIERRQQLAKDIRSGKWTDARDRAGNQLQSDNKDAVEKFVLDVARDVLNAPKSQILSEFDYPYSDKAALRGVQEWVNSQLESDPNNGNLCILNAMLYGPKAINNPAQFVAILEKAKKNASTNAFILAALGSGYGAQGKFPQAIEHLKQSLSQNNESSSTHLNLGVALLKTGDSAGAVKEMEKATELDKTSSTAWFNLGSYYAERNEPSKARPHLEKAIELQPNLLEARWNLGGIYYNTGQQAKAVEQLKEIIRIGPNTQMGRQAAQMLSQLGK